MEEVIDARSQATRRLSCCLCNRNAGLGADGSKERNGEERKKIPRNEEG